MTNITAIIGGQWGDEGKGKIVDYLSRDVQLVARFQGGANAGHTVYKDNKKIVLHQIPSGILTPGCLCVLGMGMVIDPVDLIEEIEMINSHGLVTDNVIKIALNSHIVTPIHKKIDLRKEEATNKAIGTTCRGIGPAYVDKFNRCGLRAVDLKNLDEVRVKNDKRLAGAIENEEIFQIDKESIVNDFEIFYNACEQIIPFISDIFSLVHDYNLNNKKILIEGAQGTLLDVNHGTYPFVTSSSPSTGGVSAGLGLPLTKVQRIVGIFKAYTTRVGKGPFPTELKDDTGEKLMSLGNEYGATTGRQRRCGWFDAVAARYSVLLNGFNEITLTKLDILDDFDTINVCIAYSYKGKEITNFSEVLSDLNNVKPIYKSFNGWKAKTTGIEKYDDLPHHTKFYIDFISDYLKAPIKIISTGPGRDELIIN